jgi:voltage-gated potassium channel
MTLKKRVRVILDISHDAGSLSWFFDVFMVSLIALNVLAIVLESVQPVHDRYATLFRAFEYFSVAAFTVEYILRVWTANEEPGYEKSWIGNIRYMLTPLALIDLFAILPFYLGALGLDLRLLRILRLFRLFRMFKSVRYVRALSLIGRVYNEKRAELLIAVTFTLFLLLIASALMYYVENDVQPEKFSSIPETMWWGIATLTTVGYGDVYPVTGLGRLLGGLIAVFGIGMFALPAGILASGFTDQMNRRQHRRVCPHCGKDMDDG